jgi:hypothetical protein
MDTVKLMNILSYLLSKKYGCEIVLKAVKKASES